MKALENMLDGDEPIVQSVADHMGFQAADQYVTEFNNACLQMAGFEDDLKSMRSNKHVFYAPPTNLSFSQTN